MTEFRLDESLPTPRLQVRGDVVRRNIQRMADYARQHGLQLRPHTKTHKSLHVARMQLAAGACGLTVAKVGEAEIMSQVCDDVLIAYPTVDAYRCRRVAELAGRVTTRVALDSTLAAETLSHAAHQRGTTVGVLVDVDLGYGRTGVQTDADALALGRAVARLPALRLDGIMTYTGHILGDDAEQMRAFDQVNTRLAALLDAWRAAGLCAEVVSSGSTPAAYHCHLARQFTEIRPGTYVYNDLNTLRGGYAALEDCAARVIATVVSITVANQVVLDSGSKTLTSDLCGPAPQSGYGWIVEYPDAKIVRLTEEHAQVDVSACGTRPRLGEQVTIVPNHICVCVNMQTEFWWQEADQLPQPLKVDARGLLA
jgi:D-serine deaminase-like pyridoxal phosphate-dependent protein